MQQQVPEGYTFVRMIKNEVRFFGGIEYEIDEISIIKDQDGCYYVRRYSNSCGTGGNGRPQTVMDDYCVKVSDPSTVNESNYHHLLWQEIHIPFGFRSDSNIDNEALGYAMDFCGKQT